MTEDWCSYDPSSFFRLVPVSDELEDDSAALSEAAPHLICHSDDSSTETADDCHHSDVLGYCKSSYNSHTNHDDEDDGMSICSYESDLSDLSEQSSWCVDQHHPPTSIAGLSNSCHHVSFSRDPIDELHFEIKFSSAYHKPKQWYREQSLMSFLPWKMMMMMMNSRATATKLAEPT
jgi:hypothetical protein